MAGIIILIMVGSFPPMKLSTRSGIGIQKLDGVGLMLRTILTSTVTSLIPGFFTERIQKNIIIMPTRIGLNLRGLVVLSSEISDNISDNGCSQSEVRKAAHD